MEPERRDFAERVIECAARWFYVPVGEMRGNLRGDRALSGARWAAALVLRAAGWRMPEIAEVLGQSVAAVHYGLKMGEIVGGEVMEIQQELNKMPPTPKM